MKTGLAECSVLERDGLGLLVHRNRPSWLVVNRTGLFIAKRLARGESAEGIVRLLEIETGGEAAGISEDVAGFIAALAERGFVGDTQASSDVPLRECEFASDTHASAGDSARRLARLHINVTSRCNLACRHCGATSNATGDLPAPTIRRLVDEAAAMGDVTVAFSGGEPLVRDDIGELVGYARARVRTVVTTNGLLLSKEMVRELAGDGVQFQVSLDGADAATNDEARGAGAYEQVVPALERPVEAGAPVTLVATVMRHNIDSLIDLIDLAGSLGAQQVRFMPLQRLGRAADGWCLLGPTAAQYSDFYRRLYLENKMSSVGVVPGLPGLVFDFPEDGCWCGMAGTLVVDADGSAYPCSLMVRDEFRLGNAATDSLADIAESAKRAELIRATRGSWLRAQRCRECVWRAFCQGGCPAAAFSRVGTFDGADEFCELRGRLYEELLFAQAGRERHGSAAGPNDGRVDACAI